MDRKRTHTRGRRILYLCLAVLFTAGAYGQKAYVGNSEYSPVVALKTNLLYWATSTPNIGVEVGLGKQLTLDVSGNYNPWTFGDKGKLQHWLVQPELRFWTCERFSGHFIGIHAHYADYDIGRIEMFNIGTDRYKGNLYGAGISYGYQWILGNRWNLEATIGIGYARLKYDKYDCGQCDPVKTGVTKNYFGPTKAGVTLVFIIK